MTTTFTVPRVARPISEDMFADLGVPHVDLEPTGDGGLRVTVPVDLNAQAVLRGKVRLLTRSSDDEAKLVDALSALAANQAYLAVPAPTAGQAIAQVGELTQQVNRLIEWVGRDALGGSL